jgi:hypothetical protein
VSTSASSSSSSSYSDSGNDSYSSVNHFDSDEEDVNPNNDYRKISLLQESIRLDGHVVNILYDEGVSMSLMSSQIKVPIFREIMNRCEVIAVEGEGTGLETCPIVDIPLPMYCGGGGMARVSVTARDFPTMTTDPPLEAIAEKLDFPPSVFTPRREGAVQLILGVDNRHLFPLPMVSSQDRVFFYPVVEITSYRWHDIPWCIGRRVEKQTWVVCEKYWSVGQVHEGLSLYSDDDDGRDGLCHDCHTSGWFHGL